MRMLRRRRRARRRRAMAAALRAAAAAERALATWWCRACSTAWRTSTGWPQTLAEPSPADRCACAARRIAHDVRLARSRRPWRRPVVSSSRAIRACPRPSSRRRSRRSSGAASTSDIVSLRQPTDRDRASGARRDRGAGRLPARISAIGSRCACSRGWRQARRLPGYRRAPCASGSRDLARDPTPNRIRRFGQALVLAAELPPDVDASARAFPAHAGLGRALCRAAARPALERARRTPRTSGPRPSGRSARSSPTLRVAGHLHARAATRISRRWRRRRAGSTLVYHGLDLDALSREPPTRPPRDGAIRPTRVILSVGRAVEKKGYRRSARRRWRCCRRTSHWRFVHIGGGPLLGDAEERRPSGSGIAEPHRLARRAAAGRGARRLSRAPICSCSPAASPRRRPRRPAQRAEAPGRPGFRSPDTPDAIELPRRNSGRRSPGRLRRCRRGRCPRRSNRVPGGRFPCQWREFTCISVVPKIWANWPSGVSLTGCLGP